MVLLTPEGEVDVLLVLLLGDQRSFVLGQCTSDSSGLLVSQVEGEVYGRMLLISLTSYTHSWITYTWSSWPCTSPGHSASAFG